MNARSRWAVLGTVLSVAALTLAVALLVHSTGSAGAGPVLGSGQAMQTSTDVIDPSVNEVFSPPTSDQLNEGPRLTVQQAWDDWAAVLQSANTDIPDTIHPVLGNLNLPYHADNRLTYGFYGADRPCQGTTAVGVTAPPAGMCIPWLFLDANTGDLIDTTDQRIADASQ